MIEFEQVSFTYEGQESPSLHNVTLQVADGECVLVTGPSGCGKSTLLRLANGLIPHFFHGQLSGAVSVNGQVPGDLPLYAQAGRTGSVFQNPRTQFYTTDTTSELAFGLENQSIAAPQIIERVEQVANSWQLAPLMDRSLFELSGGEKQKIACACVEVAGSPIVLLDEPTANLDYEAANMLADIVRAWKRQGKTVLIAEHRIAWVIDALDRLVVMREGRIARMFGADELAQIDEGECRRLGLRSPWACAPDAVSVPAYGEGLRGKSANAGRLGVAEKALTSDASAGGERPHELGECVLENLHYAYEKGVPVLDFDRIPLAVGKVTAVVGRNGRGKTTFLRCLAGLAKKDESVLRYHGQVWDRKERLKQVFLIQQDVNCQLFTQSVREEVEISLPQDAADKAVRQGVNGATAQVAAATTVRQSPAEHDASHDARGMAVNNVLAALDLLDVADRDPFTLSGGQKQRVAVACAVASNRPIVLFDEPTSGLGYGHMMRFAALLTELTSQGRTVVVVTHDSELIEAVADYLLVL